MCIVKSLDVPIVTNNSMLGITSRQHAACRGSRPPKTDHGVPLGPRALCSQPVGEQIDLLLQVGKANIHPSCAPTIMVDVLPRVIAIHSLSRLGPPFPSGFPVNRDEVDPVLRIFFISLGMFVNILLRLGYVVERSIRYNFGKRTTAQRHGTHQSPTFLAGVRVQWHARVCTRLFRIRQSALTHVLDVVLLGAEGAYVAHGSSSVEFLKPNC